MRKLNLNQLEKIQGGGFWGGFCKGVHASTAVYGIGVVANLWNPIGGVGAVALAATNVACIFSYEQQPEKLPTLSSEERIIISDISNMSM